MSLSSEKIQENWKQLIECIKDTFPEDYPDNRREKLLKMYHDLESRMMLTPASGIDYYHNCFPGGYVDHVLRVIDCAEKLYQLWKDAGAHVEDYTYEELVFSAMHHDLGKIGNLKNDYYIPNDSEWHRKNQGKIYNHNPELQFMVVADRSLWLLNQFEIKISMNEVLGIRLADGLYEESNIRYFKGYTKDNQLKSNLPVIIHHADMMAMRVEHEAAVHTSSTAKQQTSFVSKHKDNSKHVDINKMKKQFDELFN